MTTIDPNAPAFPFPTTTDSVTAGPWAAAPGLSIRAYFAAMAMQGFVSAFADKSVSRAMSASAKDSDREVPQEIAVCSIELADALIAELAKPVGGK